MDSFFCIFLSKHISDFLNIIKYRWEKAVLEICFKCKSKDKSGSKITPKFLTVSLEARAMSSSAPISLDNVSLRQGCQGEIGQGARFFSSET